MPKMFITVRRHPRGHSGGTEGFASSETDDLRLASLDHLEGTMEWKFLHRCVAEIDGGLSTSNCSSTEGEVHAAASVPPPLSNHDRHSSPEARAVQEQQQQQVSQQQRQQQADEHEPLMVGQSGIINEGREGQHYTSSMSPWLHMSGT
ncbi:hypothetical protein Esti_006122 [Eimeria stiedai]